MKKRNKKKRKKGGLLLLLAIGLISYFYLSTSPSIKQEAKPITQEEKQEEVFSPLVLVNEEFALPDNFNAKIVEYQTVYLSNVLAEELEEMQKKARQEGIELTINNAYRSREQQESILENKIQEYTKKGLTFEEAYEKATEIVQLPGHSEHETGLAIDFSEYGNYTQNKKIWNWLKDNAHHYGFILRYPKDKEEITKIHYEAWHYRYVGKEAAQIIYQENLCLEEYLQQYSF